MTITVTKAPYIYSSKSNCSGDALSALPTMANNGITGVWSPAIINNTAITTYTLLQQLTMQQQLP